MRPCGYGYQRQRERSAEGLQPRVSINYGQWTNHQPIGLDNRTVRTSLVLGGWIMSYSFYSFYLFLSSSYVYFRVYGDVLGLVITVVLVE